MANIDNNKSSIRLWGIALMLSGLVAGCGGGGGRDPILGGGGNPVVAPTTVPPIPGAAVLPRIIATSPVTTNPGPTPGTPVNASILAAFDKDMAPATITNSSFTLSCATPCVAPSGTVSYFASNRSATFAPAALLQAGTTYTARVTMAVTDTSGNHLAGNTAPLPASSDYVWTFATVAAGGVTPVAGNISVFSTNPNNGALAVCPTGAINATFIVPNNLRLDPASVNASTFTLSDPLSVPVVAGSITVDSATGTIASFQPAASLTSNTTYTAVLKSGNAGIKDLANPADTLATDYSWKFTTGDASACPVPPFQLGSTVIKFGTFGGTAGMTNSGILTQVNGAIGTTAVSTAVTGFHDLTVGCTYTETPLNMGLVTGSIFTAAPPPTAACPSEGNATTFSIAQNAASEALIAYNTLAALPAGPNAGSGHLGGLTLAPGVYTASPSGTGTFDLIGSDLTLDGKGDSNAVFVFQMGASLTVGSPGAPRSVILINGAQAKNVYWQVGSAATINGGGGGTMVGTIISNAGVTFSTAGSVILTTLNGRALSLVGSVTMVNTVINVPAP